MRQTWAEWQVMGVFRSEIILHLSSPNLRKHFWTIWYSVRTFKPWKVGDVVLRPNPATAETKSLQIEQDIAPIELSFPVGVAIAAEDLCDRDHPPCPLTSALSPLHPTAGISHATMEQKRTRSLCYMQNEETIEKFASDFHGEDFGHGTRSRLAKSSRSSARIAHGPYQWRRYAMYLCQKEAARKHFRAVAYFSLP